MARGTAAAVMSACVANDRWRSGGGGMATAPDRSWRQRWRVDDAAQVADKVVCGHARDQHCC